MVVLDLNKLNKIKVKIIKIYFYFENIFLLFLKKFNIKAVFYNPSDFNDLKSKISKKTYKKIFIFRIYRNE